jgi:hypothetical protein
MALNRTNCATVHVEREKEQKEKGRKRKETKKGCILLWQIEGEPKTQKITIRMKIITIMITISSLWLFLLFYYFQELV